MAGDGGGQRGTVGDTDGSSVAVFTLASAFTLLRRVWKSSLGLKVKGPEAMYVIGKGKSAVGTKWMGCLRSLWA